MRCILFEEERGEEGRKRSKRSEKSSFARIAKTRSGEHFRVGSRIVPAKCMVSSRLKTSTMVTFFKILQQQWTGILPGKRTQCSFMSAAQCSPIALEGHSNLEDRSSPQVSGARVRTRMPIFFFFFFLFFSRNGGTCDREKLVQGKSSLGICFGLDRLLSDLSIRNPKAPNSSNSFISNNFWHTLENISHNKRNTLPTFDKQFVFPRKEKFQLLLVSAKREVQFETRALNEISNNIKATFECYTVPRGDVQYGSLIVFARRIVTLSRK